MALPDTIERLKTVSQEAKELLEELKRLTELGKDASTEQKNGLESLSDDLDENARIASRERCELEIGKLDEEIGYYDSLLAIIGLDPELRELAKADRARKVARRGRLRTKLGLDFSGMLPATTISKLAELKAKVDEDTQTKKKAAAFIQATMKIVDLALTIAGKLAA